MTLPDENQEAINTTLEQQIPLPRIFISHSKNQEWCATFLHEFRKHGYDVWCDFDSLKAGQTWVQEIEKEIAKREIFIILLTAESQESVWVNQEIDMAHLAGGKCIIPVICERLNQPVRLLLKRCQMIDAINCGPQESALKIMNDIQFMI